jgi:glucose/arabinose dehydrogenase
VAVLVCLTALSELTVSARQSEGTFQIDNQFVTGLRSPTAIAFTPDGRALITEQAGTVRVISASGLLVTAPFLTLTNIYSASERGLLGIALDPNFTTNQYVYIYYTPRSPVHATRLSRVTASGDQMLPGSEVVLLEYANSAANHRGGELHFGADGKLYVAIGDASVPDDAQRVTNFNGKILRLNRDGTIPTDNPVSFTTTAGVTVTPQGVYRAIWAIGLRNPFRFAIDAATDKVHINDVGGSWEEVNLGEAGRNYGWPTCTGTCTNTFATNPLFRYDTGEDGCAITGGTFYSGNQFPSSYRGTYLLVDYCRTWLRQLRSDGTTASVPVSIPNSSVGVATAPDGSVYVLGYASGTISRVTFVLTGGNRNPVASATATPSSGDTPLAVSFNASGSTDPDGDALTYAWDFGDATLGAGIAPAHTYASSGRYVARLTVADGKGGTSTWQTTISVGAPPTATITSPTAGQLYTAGQPITFSGQATAWDGAVLGAAAFSWTVVFHHDAHTHPALGPVNGVTSGSYTPPTTGHTEENVFYRIHLTATDSAGLQTTTIRDVMPRKAVVTISSNIPGTQVLLDGEPRVTPFSFTGVVGIRRTLEVVSPQTIGSQTFLFGSWSNGGARSQTLTTPSSNTTVTAQMSVATPPPAPPTNVRIVR